MSVNLDYLFKLSDSFTEIRLDISDIGYVYATVLVNINRRLKLGRYFIGETTENSCKVIDVDDTVTTFIIKASLDIAGDKLDFSY